MFAIGDTVSYPMHGVGVVEAIESHTVLGETAEYYMLRFLIGRITAMVPVATAESVGLRAVINREECDAVIEYVNAGGDAPSDNWNQRFRENMDKLKTGEILEVADVVRGLAGRDRERGLSAGERKMLSSARQVLLAELCAVMDEPEERVAALMEL